VEGRGRNVWNQSKSVYTHNKACEGLYNPTNKIRATALPTLSQGGGQMVAMHNFFIMIYVKKPEDSKLVGKTREDPKEAEKLKGAWRGGRAEQRRRRGKPVN
jgi:hypothetical protein